MNKAAQYRTSIEAEKTKIERLLDGPKGPADAVLRNRLSEIVGELMELDEGEHWTQQQGDTLAKIVLSDLDRHQPKQINT